MLRRKVQLGTGSLAALESSLKQLESQLRTSVPRNISTALGAIGADAVKTNLLAIPNLDGNEQGTVYLVTMGPVVRVSNVGPQVGYLEFGTGAAGQSRQHPSLGMTGITHSDKLQWVYPTKSGRFATSHGLPPQRQVYDAAITVRRAAPPVAKAEMMRVVNTL